jgi:hypothetical protein
MTQKEFLENLITIYTPKKAVNVIMQHFITRQDHYRILSEQIDFIKETQLKLLKELEK